VAVAAAWREVPEEDVAGRAVRVHAVRRGPQVRGRRVEHHELARPGDDGVVARAVALGVAAARIAHHLHQVVRGRVRGHRAPEAGAAGAVVVAGPALAGAIAEVGRRGLEGHVVAVVADRRVAARAVPGTAAGRAHDPLAAALHHVTV